MPSFGYDPFGGPFRAEIWWRDADDEPFQGADTFLYAQGWKDASEGWGTLVAPGPSYEPTDAEFAALDWLVGEWDFGWRMV